MFHFETNLTNWGGRVQLNTLSMFTYSLSEHLLVLREVPLPLLHIFPPTTRLPRTKEIDLETLDRTLL